ncbi:MAG: winged helix-turn-helix domain-containing protein, partial [Kiloniellales bacterium]
VENVAQNGDGIAGYIRGRVHDPRRRYVEPQLKIIDVFVCKLRKKLSSATGGENYIETVWGRGYVLRDPLPEEDAETADEPQAATA